MIKKFLIILGLISLPAFANAAANVTVTWNANVESDLAGYKVHSGSVSGVYSNVEDVQISTSYVFSNVPDNVPLFLSVTAYDTSGNESGFSNEVKYERDTIPPVVVGGTNISNIEIITTP